MMMICNVDMNNILTINYAMREDQNLELHQSPHKIINLLDAKLT